MSDDERDGQRERPWPSSTAARSLARGAQLAYDAHRRHEERER